MYGVWHQIEQWPDYLAAYHWKSLNRPMNKQLSSIKFVLWCIWHFIILFILFKEPVLFFKVVYLSPKQLKIKTVKIVVEDIKVSSGNAWDWFLSWCLMNWLLRYISFLSYYSFISKQNEMFTWCISICLWITNRFKHHLISKWSKLWI